MRRVVCSERIYFFQPRSEKYRLLSRIIRPITIDRTFWMLKAVVFYCFLSTMAERKALLLNRFKEVTNKVYGEYVAGWRPKPFQENKSRYLWTDAYGVVNFLTLYVETKDKKYLEQAETLINVVHDVLGKTRDGKRRLDGASDEHPTLGGLRIGKPRDEGSGMDQDGQYYHYLTKWMFALNRMTMVTGNTTYNTWGIELAKTAHRSFVKDGRMVWKMSIDLRKPLTSSEGGLDPYDGLTMYKILQTTGGDHSLTDEIAEMQAMVNHRADRYRTSDSLDAGEALWLAHMFPNETYSKILYERASKCVDALWKAGEFSSTPHHRLAFREFGTTIGVQMHQSLAPLWTERVEQLHEFWAKHLFTRDADITPIMYCTSLIPTVVRASFSC